MTLDLWSILISIPLAIIANIFTPIVQERLINKKSVEKEQDEVIKKDSQEYIELIRNRVSNACIIYTPFILLIIGSLLDITNNIFATLFVLSFLLPIYLFISLIKQFKQVLKYQRENNNNVKKEIKKLKNTCISVGIICSPFIFLSLAALLDIDNKIYEILYYVSLIISIYFIIHSIRLYIQLLNKKKLTDS